MGRFTMPFFKAVLAEFLCTYIFIFTICAVGVNSMRINSASSMVASGVATGFVSIAIIYAFGDISGAHFNPAVTVGALIGMKIDLIRGGSYILAQLIAALAAVGTLMVVFPDPTRSIAGTLVLNPAKDASILNAILMEFVLTFILVFVIYTTAMGAGTVNVNDDEEAQEPPQIKEARLAARLNFAPIAIGVTLGFLCFLGGSSSGGAFNPARATAPAILALQLKSLWIYWAGDLAGAAAAAALHTYFFAKF